MTEARMIDWFGCSAAGGSWHSAVNTAEIVEAGVVAFFRRVTTESIVSLGREARWEVAVVCKRFRTISAASSDGGETEARDVLKCLDEMVMAFWRGFCHYLGTDSERAMVR